MKVLVTVKQVVDYSVKVRVKLDHSDVDTDNLKMSMNPFDEIAVEEAVRMKEAGIASEVIAVSIGNSQSSETVRTALALGADRGILIENENRLEPLAIARLLKALVQREAPDLVILGKQAIDDDCAQTGPMLAALLGWPQGTFASKLSIQDDELLVTREVDSGLETLALRLPAVITTDLRLNEPRYATLPAIMKSKRKPLETMSAIDFGVDTSRHLETVKYADPPPHAEGIKVESVAELMDKLKNEAKVI